MITRKLISITPREVRGVRNLDFMYEVRCGPAGDTIVSFERKELFEVSLEPWQRPIFRAFISLYRLVETFQPK